MNSDGETRLRLPPAERTNPLHSSDDEIEAWEYLETACPELVQGIREEIRRRQEAYRTREPVDRILANTGDHTKVEL